jgi:hypothetical protein
MKTLEMSAGGVPDQGILETSTLKPRETKPQETGLATIGVRKLLDEAQIPYTETDTRELGEFSFVQSNYKELLNSSPFYETRILPSYGCLMTKKGKQLTDLVEVCTEQEHHKKFFVLLDDKNIVIPSINTKFKSGFFNSHLDNALHYRIENDEAQLVNSFVGYFHHIDDERIDSQKICMISVTSEKEDSYPYNHPGTYNTKEYLYSYMDGKIISNGYTDIRGYDKNANYTPRGSVLFEAVKKNDWLLGETELASDIGIKGEVQAIGVASTTIFGFLGLDGLPVTDLFEIKDNEIVIYPIDRTIKANTEVEKKIKDRLNAEIQKEIDIRGKEAEVPDNLKKAILDSTKTI